VEGWKLGIQLSPQDGWALWEKGSRPTKKKKKTTGRTNNQQPIRIFMHLLFCFAFLSRRQPEESKEKDSTASKRRKKRKKKNDIEMFGWISSSSTRLSLRK
jgi:hypothetical protein